MWKGDIMDDKNLEYILDQRPDSDDLSECCNAPIYSDYGVCSDCKEGCR